MCRLASSLATVVRLAGRQADQKSGFGQFKNNNSIIGLILVLHARPIKGLVSLNTMLSRVETF